MSTGREWIRGSAKQLTFTCSGITVDSIFVSVHLVGCSTVIASGAASNSGNGYYWANLMIPATWDVGSAYYAKWSVGYQDLADTTDATWLRTQRISLVELES